MSHFNEFFSTSVHIQGVLLFLHQGSSAFLEVETNLMCKPHRSKGLNPLQTNQQACYVSTLPFDGLPPKYAIIKFHKKVGVFFVPTSCSNEAYTGGLIPNVKEKSLLQ